MKKITLVIGSMREGNSAFISRKIQEEYPTTAVFTLGGNINYCTGCLACDETHECVMRDDMDPILKSIKESDILLIVTPVRYSLMSGDVKVFIDRLNPTAVAETIVGKEVLAIAIGQTEEADGTVVSALNSIEMFADNANMPYLGGYPVYSCYGGQELSSKESVVNDIIEWVKGKIG